jgi:hypothetical protein
MRDSTTPPRAAPTLSVPTAAERTGDFSSLLAQGSNRTDTECPGVTRTYNSERHL